LITPTKNPATVRGVIQWGMFLAFALGLGALFLACLAAALFDYWR
jgi:hypothetical protein